MTIRLRIEKELNTIAIEKGVDIIYACESGSRAWGFPSKDSDYDVRFIYKHPRDWYLSISEARDVIEKPITDDLDISGWDFRKALRLFRKSNPPLMEWLRSPIVYHNSYVAAKMRSLIPEYYSQTASSYHYLHMAKGNMRAYLKGETVWIKKYFYVLRPIMAVMWMEQGLGAVPTDFNVILEKLDIDFEVKIEINDLIERKKLGEELKHGPRNEVIGSFIEKEMNRLIPSKFMYRKPTGTIDNLNKLFIDTVEDVPL